MTTQLSSDSNSSLACTHRQSASCSSCRLASICIPIALELDDIVKLETIVNRGRPVDRGRHIYRDGKDFQAIFAVRSGCVKTYRLSDTGIEQVTGFYLPGEILGLDGIASGIHSDSAMALETSAICSIPFERLGELSADIPSLQKHLFQLMGREIADDRKLIGLLSKNTAEQRMATLLLSLSQRYSARGYSRTRIRLPMSRGDIANYLGLTPETVSRVLNKLRNMSMIAIDNKELEIRDIDALRSLTVENVDN